MKRLSCICRQRGRGAPDTRPDPSEGLAGVCLSSKGLYYFLWEGEAGRVDARLAALGESPDFTDPTILKVEEDCPTPRYEGWTQRDLDDLAQGSDPLLHSLRDFFQDFSNSREVLAKYTQPTILRYLERGQNPLEAESRTERRVILFCDIVAFSTLSIRLGMDQLLGLVEIYLNACTKMITDHGGEVNKFIGDCVMAYFPEERVDDALRASLAILEELASLREMAQEMSPLQLLHCGIGLSFGPVVEGNIGMYGKMEYTIQGDPVNKAAYIESLTRELPYCLLFNEALRERLSGDWQVVEAGHLPLKPEPEPAPLYSLHDDRTRHAISRGKLLERIDAVLGGA